MVPGLGPAHAPCQPRAGPPPRRGPPRPRAGRAQREDEHERARRWVQDEHGPVVHAQPSNISAANHPVHTEKAGLRMTRSYLGLDGALLELDEVLGKVDLRRVADGVLWSLRCTVTLPQLQPNPNATIAHRLCEAAADLEMVADPGPTLWLAHSLPSPTTYHRVDARDTQVVLQFHMSSAVLARLEATREGRALRLRLGFQAHLQRVGSYLRSEDDNVPRTLQASVRHDIARDAWVTALREAQLAQTLVLEVPLPAAPPTQFADAVRALAQAHRALDSGGRAGWSACAAQVRVAIEKWPGAGSTNAIKTDQTRDLDGRMAVLRDAVRDVAHLAHHDLEDPWTRADALALFAAAASLLAREVHGA